MNRDTVAAVAAELVQRFGDKAFVAIGNTSAAAYPPPPDEMESLRADFERLASDPSHNLRRSRRGTYVNPAVANRWKWFQLGAIATKHQNPQTAGDNAGSTNER